MNRRRVVTIVVVVLALMVVVGIGVAVAAVWPMISGEEVAVGPAPAEEDFAEAAVSKQIAAPAPETVHSPGVAGESPQPADARAVGDADSLSGWWICWYGNELQPQGSQYYFEASEDDKNTGMLWYYGDPELDPSLSESWAEAEYELSDDGLALTISPVTVGFVEREYTVSFQDEEIQGRTYDVLVMTSLDDEVSGPAVLYKYEAVDPAWDEWVPEPYDPDVYVEATEEQYAVAEEIFAAHYPAFEVVAALYETGDPTDEALYIGDILYVAATIPDTGIVIGQDFLIAPEGVDDLWWLEPGGFPDREVGVAQDGTRYLWTPGQQLQQAEIDPGVFDLLATVCWDFPGAIVGNPESWTDGVWSLNATCWDAFPQGQSFQLEYTYNADAGWWELTSSVPPWGQYQ